jgi:hypothetical protein
VPTRRHDNETRREIRSTTTRNPADARHSPATLECRPTGFEARPSAAASSVEGCAWSGGGERAARVSIRELLASLALAPHFVHLNGDDRIRERGRKREKWMREKCIANLDCQLPNMLAIAVT